MKRSHFILFVLAACISWANMCLAQAGQSGVPFVPTDPIQESLYVAGEKVDEAWEAFHRAALGGTLASPAIQTKIEQALHESRLLLVDARIAAASHDARTVFEITDRIGEISEQIKEDSKRRKQ